VTKAEIQLIRSLDDARARRETGLFVAEGEKLVRELLASEFAVRKVYHTGEEIFAGVETERVAPAELERASHLKTAAGCIAVADIPVREFDAGALAGRLTLALDGVQNPGNLGTIIRLSDWFGVRDVLCGEGSADCFNPKVVQATMGAITRVAVHYGDLGAMLAAVGGYVYGTFLEGESIYEAELPQAGVVVLGSEGRGISAEVARQVSHKILIPPYPADNAAPESLNVATAAAIVLSEFRHPRRHDLRTRLF